MKADPQNFHLNSYPLKSWSIEFVFSLGPLLGPQKSVFKTNLKCDEMLFIRWCQGTTLVRWRSSARLRFAGASFLVWKLLKASRLRPKNAISGPPPGVVSHLWINPTRKSPPKFLKMALPTGFPSKTRKNPEVSTFSTLFSLWKFFAR